MKVQSVLLTAATLSAFIYGGCSSTGSSPPPGSGGSSSSGGTVGSGGQTGSGSGGVGSGGTQSGSGGKANTGGTTGSGSGGAAAACTATANVTACGGDVVGSWSVSSSCVKVSGDLDVSALGIGCKTAPVSGTLTVTGKWSAKADGTYIDGTTTKGTLQIAMPASCLMISGTTTICSKLANPLTGIGLGDATTCTDAASGGGCDCIGVVDQTGSAGRPDVDPSKNGNYATGSNVITNDGKAKFDYCVAGETMTWSPKEWLASFMGTIAFAKEGGGSGTGGSSGGGKSGTGGAAMGGHGGASASGGTTGSGGGTPGTRGEGPCDIYAAASPATPCAAAYSTIRALTKTYSGPLYQVRSGSSAMNTGSGGMTKDIGMTSDGFADTAAQDTFCSGTVCTFSLLYDQSGNKNNLKVAPKGLSNGGTYAAMDDFESSATKGMMTLSGHKVYSLYMNAREGYRLTAKGAMMPLGNTAEGIYMLADGTHYGTACCWDFGNVSTDPMKYGVMNTLFFGTGYWGTGAGNGPWFLGDFENGVWAGGKGDSKVNNPMSPSMKVPFALGILKTSSMAYAIRMADIQKATELTTAYDGASPKAWNNEGGILVGIGGDNSNNSWGTFFEGAITNGRPSDATDLAIMKNVQAAGYGK